MQSYCTRRKAEHASLTELLLPIQLSWHVMLEEFHPGVSTERTAVICGGQAVFKTLFNTYSLQSANPFLSTQATRFGNSE